MNNDNPLVPPGSFLEQKNNGRSRTRIAVFVILAVHGIGLLALLMQGCKQDNKQNASDQPPAPSNAAPAFVESNAAPPVAATNIEAPATNVAAAVQPATPVLPPASPQDYTIAAGDKFSTLAKKFNVSTKAIMDANPGVEPTKLQVGQKIHIPAPPAATTVMASASSGMPTDTTVTMTGGSQTYTVKSGDTLIAIAKEFGVKVRALRAANSFATDRIVVGQKLKIPAKSSTADSNSAPASGSNASAAAAQP